MVYLVLLSGTLAQGLSGILVHAPILHPKLLYLSRLQKISKYNVCNACQVLLPDEIEPGFGVTSACL